MRFLRGPQAFSVDAVHGVDPHGEPSVQVTLTTLESGSPVVLTLHQARLLRNKVNRAISLLTSTRPQRIP